MSTPHSVIHARSYVEEVEKKPDDIKDAKKKGVVSVGHPLVERFGSVFLSSSGVTRLRVLPLKFF